MVFQWKMRTQIQFEHQNLWIRVSNKYDYKAAIYANDAAKICLHKCMIMETAMFF